MSAVAWASGFNACTSRGGDTLPLGVGLGYVLGNTLAPQPQHEAVVLNRDDVQFHSGHFDAVQPFAQGGAQFGGNAPGPAVNQVPVAVDGAEIAPGRHVAGLQRNVNTQRFQYATADEMLQGVVAEQGQVPRPASRRNARQHRGGQAAGAFPGHGVQVRHVGSFQFRKPRVGMRQPAQAVHHQHYDF